MVTSNYVPSNYAGQTNDHNVLHQSSATTLVVNNQELGTGTLFINKGAHEHDNNNKTHTWSSAVNSQTALRRISLLYPTIAFHGVLRAPVPAVLMVINYELRSMLPELLPPTNDDSDNDSDEECSITELRFVPQNESDLEAIHSALNEGQKLHPDPADEISEDDVDIFEESGDHGDDVEALNRLYRLHINHNEPDYIEDYYEDDEEDRGR